MFKATVPYEPYFYVTCRVSFSTAADFAGPFDAKPQAGTETIVEEWMMKRYEGTLTRIEREKKWDLDQVSGQVCYALVVVWRLTGVPAESSSVRTTDVPQILLSQHPRPPNGQT